MRAVIVSRLAALPGNRGKLRALGGLGCAVAVAVPDRIATGSAAEPRVIRVDWAEDGGVRIVPIPVSGSLDQPDGLRWSRRALKRLIADFRPDVVHIEEPPGSPAAATAVALAKRLGVPAVLLATESIRRSYPFTERLRRSRTLRGASGLLGINRLALNHVLRQRGDAPHAVVPQHGVVPPGTVTRAPHGDFSIGFLSRLVPERGLDILFRASVKLTGQWAITVAGTGPAQEELESLAERLGIAARVRWLGGVPRRDLETVWPGLDCVVLPARTTQRWVEAGGGPLLDAMGHGIAVIGSNSGAIPDVIGDAGLIVPEDDPNALAAALQRLADDAAERERLAAAGRRRVVAQFAETAVARDTLAFWHQVKAPALAAN